MRIVVPFTDLSAETRDALGPFDVEYAYVGYSDTAYWGVLANLWATAEDFCIVEQDIVLNEGTFDELENCRSSWCAAPYPYLDSPRYSGLGCTRFRASLMEQQPDLMDRVALAKFGEHCPKHWCTLDAAMQFELWGHGLYVCTHSPVGHLHDWPSHGCVPRPVAC